MKHYLLVESQGAFASADASQFFALARALAASGNKVEILLIENGVMAARTGAKADDLATTLKAGIPIMADEFAMRERALARNALLRGVNAAAIGTVIERMADGWNIVWH